ncbi:MAG: hypothetical protein ACK50Y_06745 [Flavobacteriia bacterium]|jgi:iron(III) transport system substrate-binding protein
MSLINVLLSFSILSALVAGCRLETAKPSSKQHLVLATDCLNRQDQILFKPFEKRTGIKVRILQLSTDEIVSKLKAEGVNTEIDCILLSSVVEIDRISQLKSLQKIETDSLPKVLGTKYISEERSFFGIGFDPYVIVSLGSASKKIRDYSDLKSIESWCSDLESRKELFPFYSYIAHKIKPTSLVSKEEWIDDFNAKKIKTLEKADTLIYSTVLFTKYSSFLTKTNNTLKVYKKGKVLFPNQRHGGVYYDMPCFAIVKQARNFTNAMFLFREIYANRLNGKLNHRLNAFPISPDAALKGSYQTIRFKRYGRAPIRLTYTFPDVQNILY